MSPEHGKESVTCVQRTIPYLTIKSLVIGAEMVVIYLRYSSSLRSSFRYPQIVRHKSLPLEFSSGGEPTNEEVAILHECAC